MEKKNQSMDGYQKIDDASMDQVTGGAAVIAYACVDEMITEALFNEFLAASDSSVGNTCPRFKGIRPDIKKCKECTNYKRVEVSL